MAYDIEYVLEDGTSGMLTDVIQHAILPQDAGAHPCWYIIPRAGGNGSFMSIGEIELRSLGVDQTNVRIGTPVASHSRGGFGPEKAFDDTLLNRSCWSTADTFDGRYVGFECDQPFVIDEVRLGCRDDAYASQMVTDFDLAYADEPGGEMTILRQYRNVGPYARGTYKSFGV